MVSSIRIDYDNLVLWIQERLGETHAGVGRGRSSRARDRVTSAVVSYIMLYLVIPRALAASARG